LRPPLHSGRNLLNIRRIASDRHFIEEGIMRRFRTFAGVFSLALVTVPLWAEPPKADPARALVERNNAAFMAVFKSGDVAAVGRMYAEDAIAFPPDGDMVEGRPAIEAFWKGARDTGVKSFDLKTTDVTSSGNLAVETGTAGIHIQPSGQAETTANVKYVVVWKKGPAGWQIYRDIWNAMPGAPAMAATPAMEMTPGMAMPPPKATPVTAPKAMTPEMAMPPPTATPHHH
jgi:uncharacterized protein (TIGR02246 family)